MEKSEGCSSSKRATAKPSLNIFPLDSSADPYILPQPVEQEDGSAIFEKPTVSCISCFHRPNYTQLEFFKNTYGVSLVINYN